MTGGADGTIEDLASTALRLLARCAEVRATTASFVGCGTLICILQRGAQTRLGISQLVGVDAVGYLGLPTATAKERVRSSCREGRAKQLASRDSWPHCVTPKLRPLAMSSRTR